MINSLKSYRYGLVLIVGFIIFKIFIFDKLIVQTKAKIWKSVASIRWVEPRISIDEKATICSDRLSNSKKCKVVATHSEGLKKLGALASHIDSFSLHERGLYYLIQGNKNKLALEYLSDSILETPNSADKWNDFAAINLIISNEERSWVMLDRALSATEIAIELSADHSRAHFNRALTLEKLYLNRQATETWIKLEQLSDNEWANEARNHIDELFIKPEVYKNSVTPISNNLLLNQMSKLMRGGGFLEELIQKPDEFCTNESNSWLRVGKAIMEANGDNFIVNSIQWICDHKNEKTIFVVNELYRSIKDYASGSFRNANNRLNLIQKEIPINSPLCEIARSLKSSASFALTELDEAKETLNPSSGWECASLKSPFLMARNATILGSIALREVNIELAIELFQRSVSLLESSFEPESLARAKALLAKAYTNANQPNLAWYWGRQALITIMSSKLNRKGLAQICGFLAETSALLGVPHVQSAYAECFKRNLSGDHPPYLHALAYLSKAEARIALEKSASHELTKAAEIIRFNDLGLDIQAHYEFLYGRNVSNLSSTLAQASLERARRAFSIQNNREFEMQTRSSSIKLKNDKITNNSQLDEVSDLARMASDIQASTNKLNINLSLERRYRPIHEIRIESYFNNGQSKDALASLLQARGIVIDNIDRYIEVIAKVHNPNSASLVLGLVNGYIHGWLIDSSGVKATFHNKISNSESVISLASSSYSIVGFQKRKTSLNTLYQSIISPIENFLNDYETLYIVPDDKLFGVAFPALWDSRNKKFLIELINVLISPELIPSQNNHPSQINETAVIIDASQADESRKLPFAKNEALNVVRILEDHYSSILYKGEAATKEVFLDAVQNSSIVHFSGHGEINRIQPELSRLIFGSHPETAFLAEDIYSLPKGVSSKLVTLAACDTAAYSIEQPHALALVRPLLDAGTVNVIGSLKPISDGQYQRMMINFYEALSVSGDIHSSFRKMQLEEINFGRFNDPVSWGAVNLFSYIQK